MALPWPRLSAPARPRRVEELRRTHAPMRVEAAPSLRAARQVAVTSWRSCVPNRDGAARQRTRCSAPNRSSITRWALQNANGRAGSPDPTRDRSCRPRTPLLATQRGARVDPYPAAAAPRSRPGRGSGSRCEVDPCYPAAKNGDGDGDGNGDGNGNGDGSANGNGNGNGNGSGNGNGTGFRGIARTRSRPARCAEDMTRYARMRSLKTSSTFGAAPAYGRTTPRTQRCGRHGRG